jgi:hypothetical protein
MVYVSTRQLGRRFRRSKRRSTKAQRTHSRSRPAIVFCSIGQNGKYITFCRIVLFLVLICRTVAFSGCERLYCFDWSFFFFQNQVYKLANVNHINIDRRCVDFYEISFQTTRIHLVSLDTQFYLSLSPAIHTNNNNNNHDWHRYPPQHDRRSVRATSRARHG